MAIALNPQVQIRAQAELDNAVGSSRPPQFSDFDSSPCSLSTSTSPSFSTPIPTTTTSPPTSNAPYGEPSKEKEGLPYIRAIVKEVLRWRPTGPTPIPHACIKVRSSILVPSLALLLVSEKASSDFPV